MRSCGIPPRTISYEMLEISILDISLKTPNLCFKQHLSVANELSISLNRMLISIYAFTSQNIAKLIPEKCLAFDDYSLWHHFENFEGNIFYLLSTQVAMFGDNFPCWPQKILAENWGLTYRGLVEPYDVIQHGLGWLKKDIVASRQQNISTGINPNIISTKRKRCHKGTCEICFTNWRLNTRLQWLKWVVNRDESWNWAISQSSRDSHLSSFISHLSAYRCIR